MNTVTAVNKSNITMVEAVARERELEQNYIRASGSSKQTQDAILKDLYLMSQKINDIGLAIILEIINNNKERRKHHGEAKSRSSING